MSGTNIKSKTVQVAKPATEMYSILEDFNNFGKAMPENVTKFEADETSFLFGMKGMPEVRLVLEEKTPHSLIKFKAASSKLDFSLSSHITAVDENSCEVQFSFEGNFNPMLKMMVERPLKSFIETLADKMETL